MFSIDSKVTSASEQRSRHYNSNFMKPLFWSQSQAADSTSIVLLGLACPGAEKMTGNRSYLQQCYLFNTGVEQKGEKFVLMKEV